MRSSHEFTNGITNGAQWYVLQWRTFTFMSRYTRSAFVYKLKAKNIQIELENLSLSLSLKKNIYRYVLYGGMQDWNYLWTGDMEITVELSYDKWPRADALAGYWENNRHSLRAYLEQALNGVWGVVYDAQTGQPLRAGRVTVDSYYPVLVDPTNSDYYKYHIPYPIPFHSTL